MGKDDDNAGLAILANLGGDRLAGAKVVRDDLVGFVRELKRTDGPELRTLGSLSLVRQLLVAGLVDRLKLVVCPDSPANRH